MPTSSPILTASTGLLLLLLSTLARSEETAPGEPIEVRDALSGGAVVNWSRLTVEASYSHQGSGVAGRQQATEQLARQRIGPAIQDGIPQVYATSPLTIGDLMEQPEHGEVLRNRIKLWAVSEATYFASGTVALDGELDLTEYLRPWTRDNATEPPETPTVSAYTGLVIDARSTSVQPAFAPRILGTEGDELWDGKLWTTAVLVRSPAVWVADPAHPASARAGESPLVVSARAARGADLVLDVDGTAAVRRHLVGSPALGEGRVVVLVSR